jgi:hypothetical protein
VSEEREHVERGERRSARFRLACDMSGHDFHFSGIQPQHSKNVGRASRSRVPQTNFRALGENPLTPASPSLLCNGG